MSPQAKGQTLLHACQRSEACGAPGNIAAGMTAWCLWTASEHNTKFFIEKHTGSLWE